MNIIEKKLSELKPYPNNPKIHSEQQIEQLAKSIDLTKGLTQPIVIDKDNVIVAGHGRVLAAKKLKLKTVPCVLIDNLTDDEIRAYRLIDNRISSDEYDLNLEFEELSEIELDMTEFDFDSFSIDDIDEVDGYDKHNDDREYFEKTLTFPIAKKQQITNYLKKHYDEVIERIMKDAEENY